jgi:hypothetical protein
VRRRADAGDGKYVIIAQRVEDGDQDGATEYRDGGEDLTGGQGYRYAVRAFDASGRKVGKWSEAARVAIPVPNRAPAFASASIALSVAENTVSRTNIGDPAAATDEDGDALTYTLGNTADDGHFAVDAATGQLSTQGALDYESAASYTVTVTATDPAGRPASATVSITVTDVADTPPGRPDAPTFSRINKTYFRVHWTDPVAGSSAITGHELQYKRSSDPEDAFIDVKPKPKGVGTGFNLRKLRNQSLLTGTSYDVPVRAKNEQGWGEWSGAGAVTTAGAPPAGS